MGLEDLISEGTVIKHRLAKDLCFLVDSVHGSWLYGQWCNLGFTKSWTIGVRGGIRIDPKDWQAATTLNKCLRYASWESLC